MRKRRWCVLLIVAGTAGWEPAQRLRMDQHAKAHLSRLSTSTYAAGMAGRLARMGFAGNLELRTSGCFRRTAARHQPAEVVDTDPVLDRRGRQQPDSRSVVVAARPSEVPSCAVGRTEQAGPELETTSRLGVALLGVDALLPACVHSPLPSSSPSTPCGSP